MHFLSSSLFTSLGDFDGSSPAGPVCVSGDDGNFTRYLKDEAS